MNGYIFNAILCLGVLQAIFLIITLRKSVNRKTNKTLVVLLLLASSMLVTRIILIQYPSVTLFQRFSLFETIIFLYGPLSLRYFQILLQIEKRDMQKKWTYIPAGCLFLFLFLLNLLSPESFYDKINNGPLRTVFWIIEILALIHNIYFWFFLKKALNRYKGKKTEELFPFKNAFDFAKTYHKIAGILLVLWFLGFLGTNLFQVKLFFLSYDAIWIAMSVLIYIIGFFAINRPEIFKTEGIIDLQSDIKKSYQRLRDHEIAILTHKLENLMTEEKIFLNNQLTLPMLARKLETTSNDLSWLLNKVYQTNFYDFINEFRIREFIKKVENREHLSHTLLSLSIEVGFNSKSTFNKAFKAIQNETPSSFIKKANS